MEQPDRDAALERLDAFVGEWTMGAGPPDGPPWPGGGRVRFEWLEGRTWLIERWTVELPEAPDGIAILGKHESDAPYAQHYFDSRGVHRLYEMSLEDGEWKLWREGAPFDQRFTGTFSEDGNTIAGRWERKDEGSWATDFDLAYTKVG
jgi:hypothetical protein